MRISYRIITENGRYLNAGTNKPSWLTLEKAREIVKTGQTIVAHDGVDILWEIL
jgi:hypothetical protein